jgi:hypothetical protein
MSYDHAINARIELLHSRIVDSFLTLMVAAVIVNGGIMELVAAFVRIATSLSDLLPLLNFFFLLLPLLLLLLHQQAEADLQMSLVQLQIHFFSARG